MAHTFTFHNKHSYDTTKTGITVPVELIHGSNVVQVDAKLDNRRELLHLRANLR